MSLPFTCSVLVAAVAALPLIARQSGPGAETTTAPWARTA